MARFYDEAAKSLDISTLRDADIWRYLLEHSPATELAAERWLVQDAAGQPLASFSIPFHGFGSGLIISETSRMNSEIAEAVLLHLRGLAQERGKTHIRLNLPNSNDLVRAALGFNARNDGTYAWQIHLVDVARLLRKLTPVLERRIAASIFAGMTRTICLNLYQEAFELRFEQGRLRAVNAVGFRNEWGIKIPPLLFAPLLLGYRSREELQHMYPDVSISAPFQHLVDVLFPKLESFLFTIY